MNLFQVVGENYFKILSGKYKQQMLDCLELIYQSYQIDMYSYGVEKEIVVGKLTDYFNEQSVEDVSFDEDGESAHTAREKALLFIRKLKSAGWIQDEIQSNGVVFVNMPKYSVDMMRTLSAITEKKEIEYQGNVSAIYSILTNEELLDRPYSQVIIPAFEGTAELFSSLRSLSTDIKNYIKEMEKNNTLKEVVDHILTYQDEIGSKAYQRMHKNNNVHQFRNTIYKRLQYFKQDDSIMDRAIEDCIRNHDFADREAATLEIYRKLNQMIEQFDTYDAIELEIKRKHNRYLNSAVNKLKLTTLSGTNLEGKITTVLRRLTSDLLSDEDKEVVSKNIFKIPSYGVLSRASLYVPPKPRNKEAAKAMDVVEDISFVEESDEEQKERMKRIIKEQLESNTIENLNRYAEKLLQKKSPVMASEVRVNSDKETIRLFSLMMSRTYEERTFEIQVMDEKIMKHGWEFHNFQIERKAT